MSVLKLLKTIEIKILETAVYKPLIYSELCAAKFWAKN